MNGIAVSVEPDSGSDINIMDEHQFKALANRSTKKSVLHHSNMRALQNDLQVKGEFRTILRNKNRGTEAKILVIKGRINSAPLISKSTSEELGMLMICTDGSFRKQNELRIQDTTPKINGSTCNQTRTHIEISESRRGEKKARITGNSLPKQNDPIMNNIENSDSGVRGAAKTRGTRLTMKKRRRKGQQTCHKVMLSQLGDKVDQTELRTSGLNGVWKETAYDSEDSPSHDKRREHLLRRRKQNMGSKADSHSPSNRGARQCGSYERMNLRDNVIRRKRCEGTLCQTRGSAI